MTIPMLVGAGIAIAGFSGWGHCMAIVRSARLRGTFASSGPYARIRHPAYVCATLVSIGAALILASFLSLPLSLTALLLPVVYVARARADARLDEQACLTQYVGYDSYRSRTRAWWPF